MSTLADPNVRAECRKRIQRLDPNAGAKRFSPAKRTRH
jgi:hypothetical protein